MASKNKKGSPALAAEPTMTKGRALWLCLLSALFFVALCFSSSSTIKTTGMVLSILTVGLAIGGIVVLRERLTLPVLALMALVVLGGVSTFYAVAGKFALHEFLKLLCALCMAVILLVINPGQGITPGRSIASVLEGCAALVSLVSVDLISTRWISGPILSLFGSDYTDLPGVETGIRLTSMFDNGNIFAGTVGLGVLLSLGLVLSSKSKAERRVHLCCLYVTATAFLLAFSMGATAAIAAAFLLFLVLEHKDRRGDLLILMVETLVLVVLASAVVSFTSFDAWDGVNVIPLACLIVGSAALCLADGLVGSRLGGLLKGKGKVFAVIVGGLVALLALFVLVAYNWTGSAQLAGGETLRRAAYPEPGEYTLSAQYEGNVLVTVQTQNQQDTMMHTSTTIYAGDLAAASFTVPEDSLVVYFNFRSADGATLHSVEFNGSGGSGSVPLGYKLLPSFIANRLQGLWANQNAIQRTVFFEDGIKLFRRSPVIGLGLGAFENGARSVQSFFYETKYVHNHYIQALVDNGVLGLVLFLALLGLSAAAIFFARRKEDFHPLTPALGAALIFMAIHGGVEVVFSSYAYLPMAFGAFALIGLCCGRAIPLPVPGKKAGAVIVGVLAVLIVVFAVFLGRNMQAQSIVTRLATYDNLERAAELDEFEWADYELSYVMGTLGGAGSEENHAKAAEYALHLKEVDSTTIPYHLTHYYLDMGEVETAMEMAVKYVKYLSSDSEAWNDTFDLLMVYETNGEAFLEGARQVVAVLNEWNEANMGQIVLDEDALAFVARIAG